jgi:hypothetical protein
VRFLQYTWLEVGHPSEEPVEGHRRLQAACFFPGRAALNNPPPTPNEELLSFLNTRGSLLLPMLIHASINTAVSFIHPTPLIILSRHLCFVVMALLIIAATQGRLGYQRDLRETALPTSQAHREQEPAPARTSLRACTAREGVCSMRGNWDGFVKGQPTDVIPL